MRDKLIDWEKSHGYKARYVAGKIGVSDSAWSKIKQGKQAPTVEILTKFRNAFNVDDVLTLFKEE